MEQSYIKLLCKHLERRYGHPLLTTEDFSGLSDDIVNAVGERLSVSTLKRCFGRANAQLVHRPTTLNILARYLGFADWIDWRNALRESLNDESDFKSVNAINVDSLATDSCLLIRWLPDREIKLRYLGGNRFVILTALNTKLLVGDVVEIALLAQGEPMFISRIERGDKVFPGYIAGHLHGITVEKCQGI